MPLEPILLLSDVHRPYHDQHAWRLMLKVARALKPKHLVVNGDLWDCYTLSDHSKDPRRANRLHEELADVHLALDDLDALGAAHKIFLEGNHEDRLRRYLEAKAPELFGTVSIKHLLRLPERGWHHVPYKHDIRIGKLYIAHDVGTAGRYSVYRALDTYQHSIATSHTHRLAYLVEGNAVGEFKLSASFGWLGDVTQADYMHQMNARKNWALGFGAGYIDSASGLAYLTPVPIIKHTCVWHGKLYTV